MADDYEKYELECNRIRKENIKLLKNFAQWLKNANLKDKTIKQHVENIDFYINEYLLYEDAVEPLFLTKTAIAMDRKPTASRFYPGVHSVTKNDSLLLEFQPASESIRV